MALLARAPLLCAAFFAIAPLLCAQAQYVIDLPLYINQIAGGAGTNQAVVVGGAGGDFGKTAVTDWPILDGPPADPSSKVVGRARGLHTLTSSVAEFNWFTVMNLEFTDKSRYNGSTLAVIGTIPRTSQWTIVGGTGVFVMARGIVKYTVPSENNNGRVYKINAHVIYGDDITMKSERIVDN